MADAEPLRRSVALDAAPQPMVGGIIASAAGSIGDALSQIGNSELSRQTAERQRAEAEAKAEQKRAEAEARAEQKRLEEAAQRARTQATLVRARLDGAKQLDDLYNTFANDTDPATAAQRFQEEADKIRDGVSQGITDPEAVNSFHFSFGELAETRRVNLQHESLQRETQSALSTLDQSLSTFAQQAANAKSEAERAAILGQADDSIHGLVHTGMLAETEAVNRIQKFRGDLSELDARRSIFADPVKAKAALEKGAFPDLTPLQRQAYIEHAQAEIDQRARALSIERLQLREEARDTLGQVRTVIEAGYPVSPDLLKQAQRSVGALGPREVGLISELNSLTRAANVTERLRGATPQEVQGAIGQLDAEAAKGATGAVAEVSIAARKFYGAMQTGLAKDPLGWASQQGVVQLSPLQLNGQDTPDAWQQRVRAAELVARHYGTKPVYFTDAETDQLKTTLASASPDQKLQVLSQISKGLGSRFGSAMEAIAKDEPVAAHAAGLIQPGATAEQRAAARDALRGEALLNGANKGGADDLRPSTAARNAPAALDATAALGLAPEERSRIMATAEAIYAARASARGVRGADANPNSLTNSGAATKLWEESINAALGATKGNDGRQYGGLATYQGRPVVAPGNIAADDFENFVHGLSESDLKAGSVTGGAPVAGEHLFTERDLRRSYLISVGDGVYAVSTTDPQAGNPQIVTDAAGNPYKLDINRLPKFNFSNIGRSNLSPGMLEPGNIDLNHRPVVKNGKDISTVLSIGIEEDGRNVVIPRVSPEGKILSDQDAIALYRKSGQHLGKFDSRQSADIFAGELHLRQARQYGARR